MTIEELINAMYAKEELEWDFCSDGPTFGTVRSISIYRGFPRYVSIHTDEDSGARYGYQVRLEKIRRRGQ
jgi:hypothetical protein